MTNSDRRLHFDRNCRWDGETPACVVCSQDGHIVCCLWKTLPGAPSHPPSQSSFLVLSTLASRRAPDTAPTVQRALSSRPCRHRHPPSSPRTVPTYSFRPASTNHTPAFLPPLPGRSRRVTSLRAIDSQGGPPSWQCHSRDPTISPASSSPPAIPCRTVHCSAAAFATSLACGGPCARSVHRVADANFFWNISTRRRPIPDCICMFQLSPGFSNRVARTRPSREIESLRRARAQLRESHVPAHRQALLPYACPAAYQTAGGGARVWGHW